MTNLINFFNKAPITTNIKEEVDFLKLNKKAIKYGYVIHPDCCNVHVDKWLNSLTLNYNSTFYKEWTEITEKNRIELFIDQILHYATTYGQDFECDGNGYVPNSNPVENGFSKYKIIEPISYEEMYKRCLDVISSGIALKDTTMKTMCDFIYGHCQQKPTKDVFDNIKNKEAQAYLCCKFGIFPSDAFAMLRCLVYCCTGSTMLIKSRSVLKQIKQSPISNRIYHISENDMIKLSSIFYRFKPIFLAMKTRENAHIINKIRKLAKKNHKPLQTGLWERALLDKWCLPEVVKNIGDIDNFKKVKLLQAIKVALYSDETSKVYPIRNGKVYVRCNYKPKYDKNHLKKLEKVVEKSLVESLKTKACKVHIPSNFNITMPSSEKTFVGNYPFGSNIRFDKNFVVGIYWENNWGTYDFDLSFVDFRGTRIGWNASYTNSSGVIYSGDMTYANPNAVETMFIPNRCPDATVMVNQYNGNPVSKFRFFVAQEEMDAQKMYNKMVNPDNVLVDTMVDVNNQRQKTVGLIQDNTFYFMELHSGNNIVSGSSRHNIDFIKTMCARTKCFVYLKDVLKKAGFEFVDENECDINFEHPEKDLLIKLMS
jgi:hypothetical protein